MNSINTANRGFAATLKEIERRGATEVTETKAGNRRSLSFVSKNQKQYTVTTRAKTSGTWQTMVTYGKRCDEISGETSFWVFVDLELSPPKFYPVPQWWISNDIYVVHQAYLRKHGGHRKKNDNSNHHAVQVKRIQKWEEQWGQLGL